jgi:glucose-6-phosphate 1-dehydrogenase
MNEWLLHACMIGDAILFQRADVVESVWRVIEPVIDVWKVPANSKSPELYGGIVGLEEADELLRRVMDANC